MKLRLDIPKLNANIPINLVLKSWRFALKKSPVEGSFKQLGTAFDSNFDWGYVSWVTKQNHYTLIGCGHQMRIRN